MATNQKYFVISLVAHATLFLLFILGFDFAAPLPVIENTNKNDVISAVVLGDTQKSKILPRAPAPTPTVVKQQPTPMPKPVQPDIIKKDVIPLKIIKKKTKNIVANDLLNDIQKTVKQKKVKQTELKSHFQKTLRAQSEKTMRQQLLNEEINLSGTQSRQTHGVVNKYQALIIQAISEKWIIPPQVNKNLYAQLMIHLAPGGTVLEVQVVKSSGDPALDSSVQAAVFKASPLPVPSNPQDFAPFRQFVLKVKPENIMDSANLSDAG